MFSGVILAITRHFALFANGIKVRTERAYTFGIRLHKPKRPLNRYSYLKFFQNDGVRITRAYTLVAESGATEACSLSNVKSHHFIGVRYDAGPQRYMPLNIKTHLAKAIITPDCTSHPDILSLNEKRF